MAVQEYPKWMHHAEQGSRIFNTKEDLDAAGSGWKADKTEAVGADVAKREGDLETARSLGLSGDQKVADLELQLAQARKQLADSNQPPGTAMAAVERHDAVQEYASGHRGMEFSTASGAREAVAKVDTQSLDELQRTARAMGIEFDDRATLKSLQTKVKAKLGDADVSRFAQSNPPNADPAV